MVERAVGQFVQVEFGICHTPEYQQNATMLSKRLHV